MRILTPPPRPHPTGWAVLSAQDPTQFRLGATGSCPFPEGRGFLPEALPTLLLGAPPEAPHLPQSQGHLPCSLSAWCTLPS